MKQLKFVTMAAALFAVMTFTSSCSKSDDDEENETVVITEEDDLYSIYASSNAEVNYTIDVPATATPSSNKQEIVFTDIATSNTIVKVTATLINPEGYVTPSQTATVKFTSTGNSTADIDFDFEKRSTETKSQDEVKNATTDVVINSNPSSDFETQMIIPAGTTATGNTSDPFSITGYTPTVDIPDFDVWADDPEDKGQVELSILHLNCTPDGAIFNNPVTLRINAGEDLVGETLILEENGEKTEKTVQPDGFVEFTVTHFSEKVVKFKIEKFTPVSVETAKLVEKDSIVTKGKNLIEYKKFTTNQLKSPATITKKLKKILRKATPNPIMRKAISSFQSNKNSKKAKILVIQDKSLYNIIFKNKKTYAILKQKKIKIRVTFPTQNSGNGHSGGSGS